MSDDSKTTRGPGPQREAHVRAGGGKHEGPAHTSPYPLSRLSAPFDLVDVAREIQDADALLGVTVSARLEEIAEQIRSLQSRARSILDKARRDADLHRAGCSFTRRPGCVYHLYYRPAGASYLSMLSPDDWRGSPPHEYGGSFRLEADMSWTPVAEEDPGI